jgi:hypothetical protein
MEKMKTFFFSNNPEMKKENKNKNKRELILKNFATRD